MSIEQHLQGLTFKQVSDTNTFRKADADWSFESWDDKKWQLVVWAAKEEINDGPTRKRRAPTRHT